MTKHRRTGIELRDAIFEAAFEELEEVGFVGFNMENISKRCKTSKAVLYRHYGTKENLAIEVLKWKLPKTYDYSTPNNGNLRDDVIEYLTIMSKHFDPIGLQVLQTFMSSNTKKDLVKKLPYVHFNGLTAIEVLPELLKYARNRGDIKTDKIKSSVTTLPLILLRYNAMSDSSRPTKEVILEIVDDIYLPLVELYGNKVD